jgi:acyl carrier protein
MTDNDILNILKNALDEVAPGWSKDVKTFGPDVKFRDLAVDSVQIMEMLGVIEEKVGCAFADDEINQINRVGDMIALIRKRAA